MSWLSLHLEVHSAQVRSTHLTCLITADVMFPFASLEEWRHLHMPLESPRGFRALWMRILLSELSQSIKLQRALVVSKIWNWSFSSLIYLFLLLHCSSRPHECQELAFFSSLANSTKRVLLHRFNVLWLSQKHHELHRLRETLSTV